MNDFINSVFAWLENRRKAKEKEARQKDIEEIALIEAELGEWGQYAGPGATVPVYIIEKNSGKEGTTCRVEGALKFKTDLK